MEGAVEILDDIGCRMRARERNMAGISVSQRREKAE